MPVFNVEINNLYSLILAAFSSLRISIAQHCYKSTVFNNLNIAAIAQIFAITNCSYLNL